MEPINSDATDYLNNLRRLEVISNEIDCFDAPVLLFPGNASLFYTKTNVIATRGLGELDLEQKDLLSHINILDPLTVRYAPTNVLMPRTYAESLPIIPHHISVQALVFSRLNETSLGQFFYLLDNTEYNKTSSDRIWVENSVPKDVLKPGDVIIIMNRRVGGWDGDRNRPVIELLGGGGHLPTVWDEQRHIFAQMNPVDAIVKEFREELKYSLLPENVNVIGGFQNDVSNELVILCSVFIPSSDIVDLQRGALNNIDQNTDGIYLGTLEGVLKLYLENAKAYAGGEEAKASNFPSRPELMERVRASLRTGGH